MYPINMNLVLPFELAPLYPYKAIDSLAARSRGVVEGN